MKRFAPALLVIATACQQQSPTDNNLTMQDIPAQPGDTPPSQSPPPAPPPPTAGPTQRDVVSEAPFTAGSAQGAATVVQTYFALLEAKEYTEAHKLWGPSSDLADGTFAAKFAGNREYHAEVYAPGEIEGGAGSLYVEVPVKVYGVTTKGEKFETPQVVTLRRVNNVDGSTAEQRRWHIASIAEPPAPH